MQDQYKLRWKKFQTTGTKFQITGKLQNVHGNCLKIELSARATYFGFLDLGIEHGVVERLRVVINSGC